MRPGMHTRGVVQCQSRRKTSLGPPVRRACPASGATWNVQVVRGKMTSRCLWHACRALVLGLVLMFLGAGMATIGYFAEHLSHGQELRGNATVRVKNESRGYHLNNLSYVGPIVMGVGGFIVVAACVMTFEARDSAAKVVPARFKLSGTRNNTRGNSSNSRRTTTGIQSGPSSITSQSARWEQHLGLFRTSPGEAPLLPPRDRQALTAALVHFSRGLGSPRSSPVPRRISRSGSVPNLTSKQRAYSANLGVDSPIPRVSHRERQPRNSSMCQRNTRESTGGLLHPGMLQFHRHALSVDETGPYVKQSDSAHGSQSSMTVDYSTKVRDKSKRSDTARRHVLSRQKPIEKDEPHSPERLHRATVGYHGGRRRSSTASDVSASSRRGRRRASSSVSRTPSIISTAELHSPERTPQQINSPRSPRRQITGQLSTPSVEREFRSQLSICSEPTGTIRALSCQSSIEPCVPEESPESEEIITKTTTLTSDKANEYNNLKIIEHHIDLKLDNNNIKNSNNYKNNNSNYSNNISANNSNKINNIGDNISENNKMINRNEQKQKFLYRSNSSKSFKKPKPKTKLSNEFAKIYFLDNYPQDDGYDSIEVIDERRSKNFNKNLVSNVLKEISTEIVEVINEEKKDNQVDETIMLEVASTEAAATTETTTTDVDILIDCKNSNNFPSVEINSIENTTNQHLSDIQVLNETQTVQPTDCNEVYEINKLDTQFDESTDHNEQTVITIEAEICNDNNIGRTNEIE